MTVNYTSLLGLALPVTGTEAGAWGDVVNNYLTSYLDASVAGTQTITGSQTAVTLAVTNGATLVTVGSGATGSAQFQIITCTGNPASLLTITAPASSRQYIIINSTSTSQSVQIVGAGPTTGVTIVSGEKAHVAWNGSDFVKIATQNGSGDFVTVDTTNLEVTNIKAKDGTAAASIADSTGVVSITANPILSGGTANGVAYLNGSKVLTTGTALVFDGTNLALGGTAVSLGAGWSSFTTNGTTGSGFVLRKAATDYGYIYVDSGGFQYDALQSLPHRWYLNSSEAMRLNSTGLGIGTSSPAQRLQVQDSTANNGTIQLGGSTYYGTIKHNATGTGANEYNVASASGGGHIFQRGGTTQFMTDSSGNLGLGVTPSAWNASYKAFQFGAGSSLAGHTTNTLNFTVLASNQYLDAAGAAIFINNGYAPRYLQRGDTGEHYWYTTNNGSAGGTVTNTQAMTLDASGNLLVGKTSLPSGKLDVAATRSASVVTGWFGTIGTGVVGDINQVLISNVNTLGGQNQGVGIGGVLAASASNEAHLTFYSNAGSGPTERARITSGGYFKASNSGTYVNSTSAYHELYSIASGDWIAYFTQATATNPNGVVIQYTAAAPNGTGNTFLYCQDNAAVRATIRSNGGLANYQSNNVDLSDIRTKTDINPLGSYWNKIAGLEIVTYKYRDQTHDDPNIGVIAQQVEQVAPEFVDPDGFGETPEDGVPLKTIYNKDLTFAAIKALQEAMARIEQLEAKVAALEAN